MKKYYLVPYTDDISKMEIINVYKIQHYWVSCQSWVYDLRFHKGYAHHFALKGKVFSNLPEAKKYIINKITRLKNQIIDDINLNTYNILNSLKRKRK